MGKLAAADGGGFSIIGGGSPFSTIPSSILSNATTNGYTVGISSYQYWGGITYGNPLGRHLIAEGVGYNLDFHIVNTNTGAVDTADGVHLFGFRAGGYLPVAHKADKFSVGFNLLGGVGGVFGNVKSNLDGTVTTTSASAKWQKLSGSSVVPLIQAGPAVSFPLGQTGLHLTVGAAIDVPSGVVMTTQLSFAPVAWRH